MIVTSALIIWKALMCITGSESPVVVVLSGSMEPGFKRVKNKQCQHETTLCKWLSWMQWKMYRTPFARY
ncbi:hypothetical protein OIU76_018409 [Salix suchowensis]|nr:hypothetical protein OIU76_018409 [Salix suchowensis]